MRSFNRNKVLPRKESRRSIELKSNEIVCIRGESTTYIFNTPTDLDTHLAFLLVVYENEIKSVVALRLHKCVDGYQVLLSTKSDFLDLARSVSREAVDEIARFLDRLEVRVENDPVEYEENVFHILSGVVQKNWSQLVKEFSLPPSQQGKCGDLLVTQPDESEGSRIDWSDEEVLVVELPLSWAEDIPAPNQFINVAKQFLPRKTRLTTFNPSVQDIHCAYLIDLEECNSRVARTIAGFRFNIEIAIVFFQSLAIWFVERVFKMWGKVGLIVIWATFMYVLKLLLP